MIRPAVEADVPAIHEIYAPYVLNTTVTFEYDVPSGQEFMQCFLTITEKYPWLVWEEDGEVLGYAYAGAAFTRAAYSWCAEPSIYLKPEARGRGIGRRLYSALEALLREQGYQVMYAHITAENSESLCFHETMGYRVCMNISDCGFKFGRWLGLIWMEKRLTAVEIPSNFPISWAVLRQDRQRIFDILSSLSLS